MTDHTTTTEQATTEEQLHQRIAELETETAALRADLDFGYTQRTHLLAVLATHHPAKLDPAPDIDEPGWKILRIKIDGRWWTWHIKPDDLQLLAHVQDADRHDPDSAWDGHTTDQKYAALNAYAARRGSTGALALDHLRRAIAEMLTNVQTLTVDDMVDLETKPDLLAVAQAATGAESLLSAITHERRYPGGAVADRLQPFLLNTGRTLVMDAGYSAAAGRCAAEHHQDDAQRDGDQIAAADA